MTEVNGIYGLDPSFLTSYQISATSPAAAAGAMTEWTWGDIGGACFADQPAIGAYEVR